MGKIIRKGSLCYSLIFYLFFCLIAGWAGALVIGFGTNDLQEWYHKKHEELAFFTEPYMVFHMGPRGQLQAEMDSVYYEGYYKENIRFYWTFWIISNAQMFLIPGWTLACVLATGAAFYRRELREPIHILLDASRRIEQNELDFTVVYTKPNELGDLCGAFDKMRSALWENNRRMWRSLEERNRLNAAFSHDLRTPLTVMKGYADYLEKYVPEGKLSEEKLLSVLALMRGQIERLERYTRDMNAAQRLEDLVPQREEIPLEELLEAFAETGRLLCGEKFCMEALSNGTAESGKDGLGGETLKLDSKLVPQIYENLLSNAARYARNYVKVRWGITKGQLTILVSDDGPGFTQQALQNAMKPFFRDGEEENGGHFGMGLYICRVLCEKCGGSLSVRNHEEGAEVTARVGG